MFVLTLITLMYHVFGLKTMMRNEIEAEKWENLSNRTKCESSINLAEANDPIRFCKMSLKDTFLDLTVA